MRTPYLPSWMEFTNKVRHVGGFTRLKTRTNNSPSCFVTPRYADPFIFACQIDGVVFTSTSADLPCSNITPVLSFAGIWTWRRFREISACFNVHFENFGRQCVCNTGRVNGDPANVGTSTLSLWLGFVGLWSFSRYF
jgi:hypothetical protein